MRVMFFCLALLGAEIEGPEKFTEDEIADFVAKGGEKSAYDWEIFPEDVCDFRIYEHGSLLVVTGPPGKYTLKNLEVGPPGEDGRPILVKKKRTFEITARVTPPPPGPGPGPGPGPNPGPGPDPVFPDGKYKLAAKAYTWGKTLVTTNGRGEQAKAWGSATRGITSKVAAGTIATSQELLGQWAAASKSAVGAGYQAWRPVTSALQAELTSLGLASPSSDVHQVAEALNEFATGIEAVP